jgi:murein DD-endopeptidase MepM/ murein hydrolase activator NlpD
MGPEGLDFLSGEMWEGHDTRVISFENSFGQPREQSDGPTTYNVTHGAIDIIGAWGCEIRATVDGTVVERWYVFPDDGPRESRAGVGHEEYSEDNPRTGGHYVMIRDADGFYHYYAHMLSEPRVAVGNSVRAGETLGRLGASGLAPGRVQHLHYQTTRRTEWRMTNFNPYRELRRLAEDTVSSVDVRVSPGGRVYLNLA